MSSRRSREQWRELCEGYARSGLSVPAYAAGVGVNPRTLNWWRGTLGLRNGKPGRKRSQSTSFVELVAANEPPRSWVTVRVGELVIEGSDWPPASWVAELVGRC